MCCEVGNFGFGEDDDGVEDEGGDGVCLDSSTIFVGIKRLHDDLEVTPAK
ncbi:hypothetical protein Tco_1277167, partial [Tanacetum coccineum]